MSLGCNKILSATELERYRVRLERTLPVKGKKEFAPSGSWVERKLLEAARDERHALLKEERVERVGILSVAEWDEKMNVAVVTYSVGKHWENFGHQQGQIKCLNPEEALFLLETSNLLLLHNNVGLSVQQGYNTLLGQRTGCTLNCYRVFSHLARQGFRLKRHDGPLFVLTDYERRIGLQSYLYPSKRSTVSTQEQHNDQNGDSTNAEFHENTIRQITMSFEGNDVEIDTNHIKKQHADILSESHVKTETIIPQVSEEKSTGDDVICNIVKNEDSELQTARGFGFYTNNTVSDSTGVSPGVSETNFKTEKQQLSSPNSKGDFSESHQRIKNSSEVFISKKSGNGRLVEDNIHNIKHEQSTVDFSHVAVNNEENHHENNVVICDIEMKVENDLQEDVVKPRERISSGSTSTERPSKDIIKKETIHTERNCDISEDRMDSPSIIESVEEVHEVDKHLNTREPQITQESHELIKKEDVKISHEVCLISDSSVSGFSDIIVDLEEQEQNKNYGKTCQPPLVNLVNYHENKLSSFQRKMRTPQEVVIVDELPVSPRPKKNLRQPCTSNNSLKCEVDITDINSKKDSIALRTLNRKTAEGQKSFVKNSLKCEIDITDVSSAEESIAVCPDITSNKEGNDDILCVDHKHKSKRKRRISQRKSSVKSEKSYVVDVETDTLMHSDDKLVPRKVAKREKQKEMGEIIVVDDIDTQCENDEAVVLKDDDLELELTRFYEEITLIDLTGEDSRTKTRTEILDMFPNFAGVKIATVRVPPSDLLPENVTPSQEEYQIDLQNLLSDRPDWIVRRRPHRGRDAHQRFRPRRGYFRRQQYRGSPHHHMADERHYTDPQVISEEFSHNVRMDYDGQSVSRNYSNPYNHPAQENMPFAVIDTSGDFSHVRRFEHQQRFFQARSNKPWYENTWNTGPQSDAFMQHSDSPSASPQHYELMNVDNRFSGHRHNQQRWNRRYHRNPTNRRNPSGRSKFRSFHHPAQHRHTSRTANFQEETTEYNWQNLRNVSENAESWSDFKKLLGGKNCEEPSVESKLETSVKAEDGDDEVEEEEQEEEQVESLDEEAEEEEVEWKPLLQPSDCTDIGSILQKLNIFKEIPCDTVPSAHSDTKLKINYDIYLPTTKFKKSSPCLPDYRLCIIGCEEEVPSAGQISFLLKDLKDDVPLLFAVVVPDSVAFYHFVNISLPVDDSCPI
ncbi:uncharacterized protein LOC124593712 isoform X1 [Schistocerca americana]|uniref:uncharacterized protein LOC124593712 isoform X1 n=2 Tax=Schistocerca americana TaxID=7009 RepID=UPI001F4F4A62|nr:uncharacterized protein LOC124593712 isoform X1 [Schistocerca americana]